MNYNVKKDGWTLVSIILLILFIIFLLYPLFNLLKEAIYTDGRISFDGFKTFFSEYFYWSSIINSVKVAVCVMIVSLLLGIPFSYFYSFFNLKGKKVLFILCLLCTMSAPFIGAYA